MGGSSPRGRVPFCFKKAGGLKSQHLFPRVRQRPKKKQSNFGAVGRSLERFTFPFPPLRSEEKYNPKASHETRGLKKGICCIDLAEELTARKWSYKDCKASGGPGEHFMFVGQSRAADDARGATRSPTFGRNWWIAQRWLEAH